MHLIINSKKLGKKITFSRIGEQYIYVDGIVDGVSDVGKINGISYAGDDKRTFIHICLRWFRSYTRDI